MKSIQTQIFDEIKEQLLPNEFLIDIIMDQLHISKDAGYRRIRGEVPLTIDETLKLGSVFNFSLDNLISKQPGRISFQYKPLNPLEFNYHNFVKSLKKGFDFINDIKQPYLYASVSDTSILHVLNFPRLSSFKFFYWAKSYLNATQYKLQKFSEKLITESITNDYQQIIKLYNQVPSSEIYPFAAMNGLLKQIYYYFESELFETKQVALELLNDVQRLSDHLKLQAEKGLKININDQKISTTPFKLYIIDTYLPDNTYIIKHNHGLVTYFTHNVMNYLVINNPEYNKETLNILEQQIRNSTLISETSEKVRNRFFSSINRDIMTYRKKIEST